MKLNNKILLSNILLSVIVFLITSIGMYFLIKQTVYDELDNHLLQHKYDINTQIDENPASMEMLEQLGNIISNEWIEIEHYNGTIEPNKNVFSTIDTLRTDLENASREEYRRLVTTVSMGEDIYRLTLYEEVAAWNRISSTILFTILAALLIWILLLYLMNQAVINRILFPFYETVDTLETIKNPTQFNETFPHSDTYEIDVLNNALNSMMMQVKRSFEDQKMFIQNASHELLTPLSIIRQKAEKILTNSEKIDEEITSSASEIQQTAVRLSRLSNALLMISRIENRQFHLNDQVNIRGIVDDVLRELDDFILLKNISINKNIQGNIIVSGNRELIHSAIFNVVQNAIKFSPDSAEVSISFMKVDNQRPHVTIRDNGPGIPDSLLSTVFDRFKKGKPVKNNNIVEKGNGLGMSIVKSICDLHGFDCRAENSKNNGAIITIYF
ncbi:MAG: HAMP domain-containing sensor histidine kinase [Balneolaceae bacterium]|nr:HAMP domain-containing sensor histidine kinase [Balneolaceae bacterium]